MPQLNRIIGIAKSKQNHKSAYFMGFVAVTKIRKSYSRSAVNLSQYIFFHIFIFHIFLSYNIFFHLDAGVECGSGKCFEQYLADGNWSSAEQYCRNINKQNAHFSSIHNSFEIRPFEVSSSRITVFVSQISRYDHPKWNIANLCKHIFQMVWDASQTRTGSVCTSSEVIGSGLTALHLISITGDQVSIDGNIYIGSVKRIKIDRNDTELIKFWPNVKLLVLQIRNISFSHSRMGN